MLLAEGGYMVEKIAKLLYPEGQEIGFEKSHEIAAQDTLKALKAKEATLFEATLISKGKLARVDILKKQGNEFHLIEVKAKSYDSAENREAIVGGKPNLFRTKNNGIVSGWQEYLEDVAFQVLVLKELFPEGHPKSPPTSPGTLSTCSTIRPVQYLTNSSAATACCPPCRPL